jgi:hypothetical protein
MKTAIHFIQSVLEGTISSRVESALVSLDQWTQSLREESDAEIQGTRLHIQGVKTLIEITRQDLKTQLREVETPVKHRDSWKSAIRVAAWPLEAAKAAAGTPVTYTSICMSFSLTCLMIKINAYK